MKRVNELVPSRVLVNGKATICWFPDGTKTVAKCSPEDTFDRFVGVSVCIAKKVFASKSAADFEISRAAGELDEKPEEKQVTKEGFNFTYIYGTLDPITGAYSITSGLF